MKQSKPETADAALSQVVERHRAELQRFAVWVALNRAHAEDIVRAAISSVCDAGGRCDDTALVRIELFAAAVREHLRRVQLGRKPIVDLHECAPGEDVHIEGLRRAVLTLQDEYRLPLLMQVLGGFSATQISMELNLTTAVVHGRLLRAREHLKLSAS